MQLDANEQCVAFNLGRMHEQVILINTQFTLEWGTLASRAFSCVEVAGCGQQGAKGYVTRKGGEVASMCVSYS